MRRRTDAGAAALPAALLLVALAAALAAALADLARISAFLARNRLAAARALAAADACLADVVAVLPAGWTLAATLDGPDGVAGTADDGTLDAPPGCTATATAAPGPAAPPRLLVGVEATAGSGRRLVEAIVGRDPAPGAGALVWLEDGALLGAVTGSLSLDGTDAADPTLPPASSLAAPVDPAVLDAWLVAQGVAVAVPDASPRYAPGPPIADLVARAAAAGALPPAATLVTAGVPVPALTLAPADLLLGVPLRGAGLLVVAGRLDIQAPFEFTGVVVASGGMRVAGSGGLAVGGAVWLGPGAGGLAALEVAGPAAIQADAAAVAAADALLPLPRRARVAGVRDG